MLETWVVLARSVNEQMLKQNRAFWWRIDGINSVFMVGLPIACRQSIMFRICHLTWSLAFNRPLFFSTVVDIDLGLQDGIILKWQNIWRWSHRRSVLKFVHDAAGKVSEHGVGGFVE